MSGKGPNMKSYLDKSILLHINKNRKISGTLRGYDQFMNVVLEDAIDMSDRSSLGMIVGVE